MVTRIETNLATARWATHIARMDTQKLTADLAAGANPRVIADDRAALARSRGRLDLLV